MRWYITRNEPVLCAALECHEVEEVAECDNVTSAPGHVLVNSRGHALHEVLVLLQNA